MEDKLEKQKLIDALTAMRDSVKDTQDQYRIKPEDINRFYYLEGAIASIDGILAQIESGEFDWKTTIILPR